MFCKRHYEAIAQTLQDLKPREGFEHNEDQWQATVDAFAMLFARDSGQFKMARFVAACEPGANVRART